MTSSFNPGNGGELVNNAVQLLICGGDTGQARKENSSQAVAESGAVASQEVQQRNGP